jgi:hypothetical protein
MVLLEDFDPKNKTHVEWLKEFMEADVDKKMEVFQKNPIDTSAPPFEMIHILFGLSAKYTRAVFDKTAILLN